MDEQARTLGEFCDEWLETVIKGAVGYSTKEIGKGCKFCSSDHYSCGEVRTATIEQIVETVQEAWKESEEYSLALSGGSMKQPDRGAKYFAEIVKKVIDVTPDIGISVELAPPTTNNYIDLLVEVGVKTLIMNLEFCDEKIRVELCPGKSEISQSRYFEALSYAVEKLGRGNVSSVLIAGLEDVQKTIEGARKLIDIGVMPTIMPFRPYDLSEMNYSTRQKVTSPEILFEIERDLKSYIYKNGYKYGCPNGCLNCNACIATNLWNERTERKDD